VIAIDSKEQTDTPLIVLQAKLVYKLHRLLQPSPLSKLPSSHCSPIMTLPSPQVGVQFPLEVIVNPGLQTVHAVKVQAEQSKKSEQSTSQVILSPEEL
jgi:hypothetical protein